MGECLEFTYFLHILMQQGGFYIVQKKIYVAKEGFLCRKKKTQVFIVHFHSFFRDLARREYKYTHPGVFLARGAFWSHYFWNVLIQERDLFCKKNLALLGLFEGVGKTN